MKKISVTLIAVFFFFAGFAQTNDSTQQSGSITHPEVPAEFIGGNKAWITYLQRNLKHDLAGRYLKIPKGEKNVRQTVRLLFDIDITGHTSNIVVENLADIHPELAKEGIRIITVSPLWKPASQDGKPVVDKRRQLVTFINGPIFL